MTHTDLDLASITSLVLTVIAQDDALRAEQIASITGLTSRQLRPALRQLVEVGVLVTTGRTRGTVYCLAVEEQVEQTIAASDPIQSSPARSYRTRTRKPAAPATTDELLLAALAETASRCAGGQSLMVARRRAAIRSQLLSGPAMREFEAELHN